MQNNHTYPRIPLSLRLERIHNGQTSSPDYARVIIDRFCDLPVLQTMEEAHFYPRRQMIYEALSKRYPSQNLDGLTFGDLCCELASEYRLFGDKEPAAYESLFVLYLMCFDDIYLMLENRSKIQEERIRESLTTSFQIIFDLMHLRMQDYFIYSGGKTLPRKYRRGLTLFQQATGYSTNMTILDLFREHRLFYFDPKFYYDYENTDPIMEKSVELMELLVLPIAAYFKNRRQENAACDEAGEAESDAVKEENRQ